MTAMEAHDKITITQVKQLIKKTLGVDVNIKTDKINVAQSGSMSKKIFKQIIKRIEEIDERSTILLEKYKIDLCDFEDQYFEVIELLFRLNYTDVQVDIIKAYLYINRDEDGRKLETIEITKNKETQVFPFRTVDDLWEVLQKVH